MEKPPKVLRERGVDVLTARCALRAAILAMRRRGMDEATRRPVFTDFLCKALRDWHRIEMAALVPPFREASRPCRPWQSVPLTRDSPDS
ncbi:hypothetical protein F3J20_07470 [Paraburkholderia sp. Cy-641]|nr:hypothetical protein [Paraburkholderia sp. Cy-641]